MPQERHNALTQSLGGEAADWLDRTVQVPKVSSLTPEQWIEEHDKREAERRDLACGDGETSN